MRNSKWVSLVTVLLGALLVVFTVNSVARGKSPAAPSESGATGKTSDELKEYSSIKGHLTDDKEADQVALFSPCGECLDWEAEQEPKLNLQVTINRPGKKPLQIDAPDALCFRCGGAKGVPITGLPEITNKKILQISYNGGSRAYWTHIFKWRFNDSIQNFELIGYNGTVVDSAQEDPVVFADDQVGSLISSDINYKTGKIVKKVVGKNLRAKTLNCRLPNSYKTPAFATFSYSEFNSGDEDCN